VLFLRLHDPVIRNGVEKSRHPRAPKISFVARFFRLSRFSTFATICPKAKWQFLCERFRLAQRRYISLTNNMRPKRGCRHSPQCLDLGSAPTTGGRKAYQTQSLRSLPSTSSARLRKETAKRPNMHKPSPLPKTAINSKYLGLPKGFFSSATSYEPGRSPARFNEL